MPKKKTLAPESISAQALRFIDTATGGVTPAIHLSSTNIRDENYELLVPGHSYGRDENATHRVAEAVLCELEHAADTMLFSSGMAAAMAVVQSLEPGDQCGLLARLSHLAN